MQMYPLPAVLSCRHSLAQKLTEGSRTPTVTDGTVPFEAALLTVPTGVTKLAPEKAVAQGSIS